MAKFYQAKETAPTRSVQIYPILIAAAHQRRTLTYNDLASILGFEGAGVFNNILGHLMHWCADNRLPPLTVLVVNSKSGLPGAGLTRIEELHSDREKVYNFEWYRLMPPNVAELTAAAKNRKQEES